MRSFLPGLFLAQRVFKWSIPKLAFMTWLLNAGLAHSLEFEFVNKGAIPLTETEMSALKRAGLLWGDKFTDPITVKVNVDWQKPDFFVADNVLASVQIGRTTAPVTMVRDGLLAEADASEHSLLSALPLSLPVDHASNLMKNVSMTLANAKALGITPANDPHFGEVLLNNADAHISFNIKHYGRFFYNQGAPQSDKYDFTGVAAHEIGHVLGFTSIVDVQSMNPGVVLNPMLLDVFRFPGMASAPSLSYDVRQTTPAYAQFYDDILKYEFFGSGYDFYDPVHCALSDGRCSASHWDDASGNLMTSASQGKVMGAQHDDAHAIDRLGVDMTWRSGIPLINVRAEFYDITGPLPPYDKEKFATQMKAPSFSSVTPNFSAAPTHAFYISIDGHAGTGYAVFVPETKNTKIPAVNFYPRDPEYDISRQWEAETPVESMQHIPAHFSHFYFQSKNSSYRFNFVSTFSNYGAIFDPHLGPYGGFRLSGFWDGELDGNFLSGDYKGRDDDKPNDYDATMTMLLLLQKPHDIADGIEGLEFAIKWQGKEAIKDNILHLIDNSAFGAPPGYNNSSSYEEAWEMRVKQLDGDTEPGRDIAL